MKAFYAACFVAGLLATLVASAHTSVAGAQSPGGPIRLHERAVSLTVRTGERVKAVTAHSGTVDVGIVRYLDPTRVEQVFRIVNTDAQTCSDLTVTYAPRKGLSVLAMASRNAAAGWTAVLPGSALPALEPQDTLLLRLAVDIVNSPPGPIGGAVQVVARGQAEPAAEVELTGELLPSVVFHPAFVDFGRLRAGSAKSVDVTVVIDPRLVPPGSAPFLFCSNPNVTVTPVTPNPAYFARSPLLTPQQRAAGVFSYRLTVSGDAPIGPITGSLQVASILPGTLDPHEIESPSTNPAVLPALRSGSATLVGRVVGDASLAPDTIDFGAVPSGKQARKAVWLSAASAARLDGIRINTVCRWLSARLDCQDGAAGGHATSAALRWRLEILLSDSAPPGRIQTEMVIRLTNGQVLVLPVSAVVGETRR